MFSAADVGLAQSVRQPSDAAELPVHLGPLGVAPRIRISTGVDNNILNDPLIPKEDWITTITPEARGSLRMGRARLAGQAVLTGQRFRTYNTESTVNVTANAGLGVSVNRTLPFVEYSLVRGRDRQGFEIDTRPLRRQEATTAGLDVSVSPKLTLGMSATRGITRYEEDEEFRGTSLSEALNRDVESATFSLRRPLSALTTLDVSADWTRDEFLGSPERNAESQRVGGGLMFKPTALVSGGFSLGYLRFMPIDPAIEQFRGMVTKADLTYTMLGVTRFGVLVDRHVDYSYDSFNPYYVVSGGTVSITQRAGDRWSIWGNFGRYGVEYLPRAATIVAPSPVDGPTTVDVLIAPPTDVSDVYVAGLTWQFNRGTDLALSAERFFRYSSRPSREYKGTRVKVTLAHSF